MQYRRVTDRQTDRQTDTARRQRPRHAERRAGENFYKNIKRWACDACISQQSESSNPRAR